MNRPKEVYEYQYSFNTSWFYIIHHNKINYRYIIYFVSYNNVYRITYRSLDLINDQREICLSTISSKTILRFHSALVSVIQYCNHNIK